jgi:hypothetical protein
LPSDPSSNLILATKSGSTIPPDGPIPQPEQLKQKKNIINQQTQNEKRNTRKTRINIQKKYSQNKFLPVCSNRIALQYATLKQDTSRYREEMQTKFKYPAEMTANVAKIPRQMSLFIKQDQITSNPRNDSKTTATQGKHHTPIPRKKKLKTNSEQSNQNYFNFQTNLNNSIRAKH